VKCSVRVSSGWIAGRARTARGTQVRCPRQGPSTLDGANNELKPGAVVSVSNGVVVPIFGPTITGGYGEHGGGIHNEGGSLTITDSTLTGDAAERSGGIWNEEGSVTLARSTVVGNHASESVAGVLSIGVRSRSPTRP
jgi:hypothetical protein